MSNPQPTTAKDAGSNIAPAGENKNKDIEDQAAGMDSGFLSGPQSSFCEDHQEEPEKQSYVPSESKENNLNKPSSSKKSPPHDPKKSDEASEVLDSGCIEECVEEEDDDTPSSTDAKAEQQAHNTRTQSSDKLSNISLQKQPTNNLNASTSSRTSGEAVAATPTTPTTTTKTTEAKQQQLPAWEQCYQQNDEGDTYLHLACISGHEQVVAALIRLAIHPCLLNIKNDYGQTPLHLAALTNQRKILRMLLLAGAKPSIRDSHGNTALHLACMSGDEQCVNALTMPFSASEINEAHRQFGYRSNDKQLSSLSYASLPPDMEIRNYNGEFCVHIAAEAGHINILYILTQYGADINAREGKGGYTPLHIAIERGNEELFKFLIEECKTKLNLETETFGRLTAYQFASMLKRTKMQSLLETRGAEPLTPPDSEYESSDDESDLEDSANFDRFGDASYFGGYKGANAMAVM